ncbi:MAG: hypothetical protein ACR2HF_09090 [Methylococcaceae bacterium]
MIGIKEIRSHGRDELTRKDKYVNPYQGREYGEGHALEVMTMAFEYVLGYNEEDNDKIRQYRLTQFKQLYLEDRNLFDFVVGLLFHWNP